MSRRLKATIALSVLFALALGLLGERMLAARATQQEKVESGRGEDLLSRIDRKALAAKHNDPDAVSALADEIVNSLPPRDVPAFTRQSMKDRLMRAELHYRQTGEGGVTEESVVRLVNGLAAKFGTPEYAKTDARQVRFLRVRMMANLPNFIGRKVEGTSISLSMPPLEGAAVAMAMLQQKMHNDLYQVMPEEFEAHAKKKWKEELGEKEKDKTKKAKLTAKPRGEKHKEMREAVAKGGAAMSPDELMGLADTSLDMLGVKR